MYYTKYFSGISLSSLNIEVERIKTTVKTQAETNQGLSMKINEGRELSQRRRCYGYGSGKRLPSSEHP